MSQAKFTQIKNTFSMTCAVEIGIRAAAGAIWALLTDAKGFPRWNSTVNGIEGEIREGERLKIYVPGSARTFKARVSGFVPEERMVWCDGVAPIFKGVRSFVLRPHRGGLTEFVMEERFSGLAFAMAKGSLPDFRPIFESYAEDLKREAERAPS